MKKEISDHDPRSVFELSKRDFIAMMVLQGIVSNESLTDFGLDRLTHMDAAMSAIEFADSLLEALEYEASSPN